MKTLVLFIFVSFGICLFNSCQKEMAVESVLESIPKYDTLTISSNPIGASVYIDGKYSGYKTPAKIKWIEVEDLSVTFKLPPYADKDITIPADSISKPQFFDFLTDDRNFGAIECTSSPSGADIYLNNMPTGKKTPYTIEWLRPGDYRVEYRLTNHKPDSGMVLVYARNDNPAYQNSTFYKILKDYSLLMEMVAETGITSCTKIYIDRAGDKWIYSGLKGLYRWNDEIFKRYYANVNISVDQVFRDSKGNTWFASGYSGLLKIGEDSRRTTYDRQNYRLPSNDINSICEDTNGNLWAATAEGVVRVNLNSAMGKDDWETITSTENPWLSENATNVVAGKDGSVWISFQNKGVSKYKDGKWTNFNHQNSTIPDIFIRFMYTNNGEDIYFTTYTRIFKYSNGVWSTIAIPQIGTCYESYIDPDGNIFNACGSSIIIVKKDGTIETISTYVHGYPNYFNAVSIGVDSHKSVYVATTNMGIVWLRKKY